VNIFIDESGSFATHKTPCHSLSAVGALVVPEWQAKKLWTKYDQLRPSLPKEKGEVKGRLLNEQQVANVLELLRKNSCIFEGVVIDMGLETEEGLELHRTGQAGGLTDDLTEEHHPELVASVWKLRRRLEAMPLSLYAQSVVTLQLIWEVLKLLPVYWGQRVSSEILNYHWVIDGKEVGRVTDVEEWWSTTMLGLLQSRSYRDPMIALEGIDYTHFDAKFRRARSDWHKEKMPGADTALDLWLLLKESFRFSSDPEPGLELADIVTNATRRALAGNLQVGGWKGIPRLMIHRKKQCLNLVNITSDLKQTKRPYGDVVARGFRHGGRSLLTRYD
jgi:hypothetical protein